MTRLLASLVALCIACSPIVVGPAPPRPEPPPAPPVTPAPVVDAGPVEPPKEPATCATACTNQRGRGCALGDPTPKGASCELVCQAIEEGPIRSLRWDLECLTTATACGQCK